VLRSELGGLRRAVAAALVVASALATGDAAANIAAPTVRESLLGEPVPLGPTRLVVASEDLSFECHTKRALGECDMRAAYRIANPSNARETITAAFATYDATGIAITVDGAPVQLSQVTSPVAGEPAAGSRGAMPVNARVGFPLDIPGGGARVVVVTAVVPLGRFHQSRGYSQPPAPAWHPWAGQALDTGSLTLDYLMAPINSWAGVGNITISVRYPSWWSLRGRLVGHGRFVGNTADLSAKAEPAQDLTWTETRDGGAIVARTKTSGRQRERLAIELTPLPPILENGGGFIGAGGRIGSHGGPRFRVGYDVALRQILMVSLAAESDLTHMMQIVPAAELATPAVWFLPSVGIGLGVPIQVRPDTRAGVRIEGSIHWFPLGFVTALDIFPLPGADSVTRLSFLGQFSF
jgi:hypothetical protein